MVSNVRNGEPCGEPYGNGNSVDTGRMTLPQSTNYHTALRTADAIMSPSMHEFTRSIRELAF